MDKTSELVAIAQRLARETPDFHTIKGPGKGDQAAKEFLNSLRNLASEAFDKDYSQKMISGDTKFTVNFWFPGEMTVVECALTLRNSSSEFHKDIFKVLLAVDSGKRIRNLVFLCKPGALKRHSEPASRAIIDWLKKNYDVETKIVELR